MSSNLSAWAALVVEVTARNWGLTSSRKLRAAGPAGAGQPTQSRAAASGSERASSARRHDRAGAAARPGSQARKSSQHGGRA
jgi:hypothetical protein